ISELLWRGARALPVSSADGAAARRITLDAIVAQAKRPA
ncbi:ABC transporter ATP-binding protein, partial [Burkholderia pseudomallei]